MNPLEKFERAIGKVFRPGTDRSREPVELRREVLRDVAEQVQPAGGGDYIFPYTGIGVELFALDATLQAPLEAIFSLPGFADDVRAALSDRGCKPKALDVEVAVRVIAPGEEAPSAPYRIAYRRSVVPGAMTVPRPRARLLVLAGSADVSELNIDRNLVYIGRLKDVVNSKTGLDRRNLLAFDASETTVSRKHARLEYDPDSGRFRLLNDPEQTSVSRDGRGIPCDATRGVQLRSGDELILGKARVRFEIDPIGQ
jgi:hypothetical protein